MRRAQWTALGLTPADMEKPKVAIVNSSSGLASCFSHLDGIVGPLRQAITAAGGVGGPLGLVHDGDVISVDVDARTLDLHVPEAELARRRAGQQPLPPPTGCGWLSVYARSVRPLGQGATLGG